MVIDTDIDASYGMWASYRYHIAYGILSKEFNKAR